MSSATRIRISRRCSIAAIVAAALFWASCNAPRQNYHQKIGNALAAVDEAVAQGPFSASWESLENYQAPQWYVDGKFGIFIHWGVYSVPAFSNEWYPRNMYQQGHEAFKHHVATYGPQIKFGYKDLIPQFRAEKYDAAHWAELFRRSGARFVVPVAEHHDGFPLYDSSFTEWSAAKMGPKRDVIGELAAAVRRQGLHFGASSHRAENWWYFDGGRQFDSDVQDPRYSGLYGRAEPRKTPDGKESQPDKEFLDDWLARTAELVDRYQPELIWFDWWIEQPVFQPYLQRFAAFYYNRGAQWNRGVAINYKHTSFPEKAAVLDIERGQLETLRPLFWQTDTSVCKRSWGYVRNHDYKTVDSIVDDLVDIVSKNGALLLNIAPRPDGTIPEEQQQILHGVGKWLAVNGEAIYGARPWKVYGEGPTEVPGGGFTDTKRKPFTVEDIRFTAKGDTLYAVALAWPEGGKLTVKSLAEGSPYMAREIQQVHLLGSKAPLKWTRTTAGLMVELPEQPAGEHAFAVRILTGAN